MENKIRQRLDLQDTRRQQLAYKEMRQRAERKEEEEFRLKVFTLSICYLFHSIYPIRLFLASLSYDARSSRALSWQLLTQPNI